MSHVLQMLESHPKDWSELDLAKLTECIEACFDCAQACTACADACLAEHMVSELVQCIRTDLDCAAVCATTGTVLSATPVLMRASPRHSSKRAGLPAGLAQPIVRATPACTSTAGSAPRRVAVVRRRATSSPALWGSSRCRCLSLKCLSKAAATSPGPRC